MLLFSYLVTSKHVLELGSGVGFLGIIVATLQQLSKTSGSVWLTDLDDEVLSRCRDNLILPRSEY
jgi:tRNA1(Val) A37 N6-methylase TrmN6